ncbi:MAG: septal ring lytic transglycosylase RlpA family protein, partial [Cyanobacteria bacterium J06627_8]
TVYVRGIPIVTFLGDDAIARATSVVEETSQQDELNELEATSEESSDDATAVDASATENKGVQPLIATEKQVSPESSSDATQSDKSVNPVQSAAAIAERLNRLYTSDIDPNNIIAAWNEDDDAFVIRAGEDVLVEFNSSTILPDTTGSLSEDVLQATNRIRRQFGAEPLTEIDGLPSASRSTVAAGPVRSTFTGPASWYGPGFHGRRSASGEVFNQNAMTAAHRTLPFGTVVRVTNMTSGASVVVRINDRGPFGGGRVLDLSAGAARAIGMIQAGVANVRVDVLDAR